MSLTHWLIFGLILVVVFNRNKVPALGRSIGESLRQFKKGVNGEGDIDVTDSVKQIKDDDENKRG